MQNVSTMAATQVTIGTDVAEYEISIRPFKQKQDHEDMNVNVKSLVSIFEHEDAEGRCFVDAEGFLHDGQGNVYKGKHLPDIVQCSAQLSGQQESGSAAHVCRKPERVIDDEDPPVTLLAVTKTNSKKDSPESGSKVAISKENNFLISDHPHFIKNNIVTKYVVKEKIAHDLRRCYSDSWGSYGLADDAALLEALKDVIDKPVVTRGGKTEKKSRRIRLPKKPPAPTKPFQEQIKDIFHQDKATLPGTISSDSENDSEKSCPKIEARGPSEIVARCRGTCQGTYNVMQAAGAYGGSLCPVCRCSLEKADKIEMPPTARNRLENERFQQKPFEPARDVVNIVLVERSSQHNQWQPPLGANLEAKPPKVSRRHKATVERKILEVCLKYFSEKDLSNSTLWNVKINIC